MELTMKKHPLYEAKLAIVKADELRLCNKLQEAALICDRVLQTFPDYFLALLTFGMVEFDKKNYRSAISYLSQSIGLDPTSSKACLMLSACYGELEYFEMALHYVDKAIYLDDTKSTYFLQKCELYLKIKDYEAAVFSAEAAYKLNTKDIVAQKMLIRCLRNVDRDKDAFELFGELRSMSAPPMDLINVALDGDDAYFQLLSNSKNLISKKELKSIETYKIKFYDFHLKHGVGDYEGAWASLKAANSLKFEQTHDMETARKHKNYQTRRWISNFRKEEDPTQYLGAPISLFILGPSRSGKTTAERILGNSKFVKRGFENPIISIVAKKTTQHFDFPPITSLGSLDKGMREVYKNFYVQELSKRTSGERIFINTMPPLINDSIIIPYFVPNAKFLFIKRNRDDLIFRIYSKFYKSGNTYAYRLSDVNEYIDFYYETVERVCNLYPNHAAVIGYEDFCFNPENLVHQVQNLCSVNLQLCLNNLDTVNNDIGVSNPYLSYMSNC